MRNSGDTNARDEFVMHTSGKKVHCAQILYGDTYSHEGQKYEKTILLHMNYSKEDYEKFLNQLDFHYDSGFGGQNLFGCIWYMDMSWSTRGEYDGSEWWEHHSIPEIPFELFRNVDKIEESAKVQDDK